MKPVDWKDAEVRSDTVLAVASHLFLLYLIFAPGMYPGVIQTSGLLQAEQAVDNGQNMSEIARGYYSPRFDSYEVYLDESHPDYESVKFHEQVHKAQYNILPVSWSPLAVMYGSAVVTVVGILLSNLAFLVMDSRAYLLGSGLMVAPTLLSEFSAYYLTYRSFGDALSFVGMLDYGFLVLAVVWSWYWLREAEVWTYWRTQ